MNKKIILLVIISITIMLPTIDILFYEIGKEPIFSNEIYYKPHSTFKCFCSGQRLYDGPYYEIYHDSDTSLHGKPSNLIPILGTKCKFRLTSL